jgi:hypothetical protein
MEPHIAIYARNSSELSRAALPQSRTRSSSAASTLGEVFEDRAISGASAIRLGYQVPSLPWRRAASTL